MKKIKEINIEKNHYIQIYTMYSIQYGTYNIQYINYCMYVYIYICNTIQKVQIFFIDFLFAINNKIKNLFL